MRSRTRDQKLGMRERDLQSRSSTWFIVLSAISFLEYYIK